MFLLRALQLVYQHNYSDTYQVPPILVYMHLYWFAICRDTFFWFVLDISSYVLIGWSITVKLCKPTTFKTTFWAEKNAQIPGLTVVHD